MIREPPALSGPISAQTESPIEAIPPNTGSGSSKGLPTKPVEASTVTTLAVCAPS